MRIPSTQTPSQTSDNTQRIKFKKLILLAYGLCLALLPLPPSPHAMSKSLKTTPTCKQQLSTEMCHKIGQMLIVGFGGLKQDTEGKILWEDPNNTLFKENSNIANAIKNQYIGGVILFSRPYRQSPTEKFIRDRNIQSAEQTAKLTADLENYSKQMRKDQSLPEIPLFISVDQEGGMVDRFPKGKDFSGPNLLPQALGANEERALSEQSRDPESTDRLQKSLLQTRQYADQMATRLNRLHFNLNFAPCVDVNINPLNPILGGLGRCFSANEAIVAHQAWEFVQAFHQQGILATLKHFPGHGSSLGDTHLGLVDVTDTYNKDKELSPYQRLIEEGYEDIIMTTHVINGQIDKTQCKPGSRSDPKTWCPGTMSQTTLTKLLREQLGFKGVIVSDDMTMGAISDEYPLDFALEKGINAGVEIFIISNNTSDKTEFMVNTIAALIKSGKVQPSTIDKAYQHIVAVKNRINAARGDDKDSDF